MKRGEARRQTPAKAILFVPLISQSALYNWHSTYRDPYEIEGIRWLFWNYHLMSYEISKNYNLIGRNYYLIAKLPPYFPGITTLFSELPPYSAELPPYFRN